MNKQDPDVNAIYHDTEVTRALSTFGRSRRHQYDLQALIDNAQKDHQHTEDLSAYDGLIRAQLSNAVFVGHINTDLDSVAGAIGAAALFGGTPAISEPPDKLNGEIRFALDHCGIETPTLFDHLEDSRDCDVVLVDHTEEKQMVPSIRDSTRRATRIVGILDHHALARSFYSSKPIFMDLRPWGSVSTIIAVLFVAHKRALPKPLAMLLLQAILSDTLNLRSVTTTDADRGMVALLSSYAGIGIDIGADTDAAAADEESGIDLLAKRQFQAKTDWVLGLGAYEMVRGDQKDFSCGPWKFGISVLEVTDARGILDAAYEILLELRLLKKEKGLVSSELPDATAGDSNSPASPTVTLQRKNELDFSFLFVVNVVEHTSVLLIPGGRELALAKAAFLDLAETGEEAVVLKEACAGIMAPGSTIRPEETAMFLPEGYVSRKAQFVPALFQAIERNFRYEAKGPVGLVDDKQPMYSQLDTQSVLDAIRRSKLGPDIAKGDGTTTANPNAQHILQEEQREEAELLANVADQASRTGGNLYDENGRIRRHYQGAFSFE